MYRQIHKPAGVSAPGLRYTLFGTGRRLNATRLGVVQAGFLGANWRYAVFTSFSGFKTRYGDLTAIVISEFNEWKVLAYAPGLLIHGTRQLTEDKAKEHALFIVQSYLRDERHQELPSAEELKWEPTAKEDWIVWRS